jgi:hypothetical protein
LLLLQAKFDKFEAYHVEFVLARAANNIYYRNSFKKIEQPYQFDVYKIEQNLLGHNQIKKDLSIHI